MNYQMPMSGQTLYIRGSQGVGKDTLARFLSILNLECRVRVIKAGGATPKLKRGDGVIDLEFFQVAI